MATIATTTDTELQALGKRLQTFRHLANLTQEALADRAGITANFVAHLERGSRKPSVGTLVAMARVLDVPVGSLFGESGGEGTPDSPELQRLCRMVKRLPATRYRVFVELASSFLKPA